MKSKLAKDWLANKKLHFSIVKTCHNMLCHYLNLSCVLSNIRQKLKEKPGKLLYYQMDDILLYLSLKKEL